MKPRSKWNQEAIPLQTCKNAKIKLLAPSVGKDLEQLKISHLLKRIERLSIGVIALYLLRWDL